MDNYQVWDFDDFGVNHIISDQCQSHDCRDALLQLKEANNHFKVTLFAIPDEMTIEMLEWSKQNGSWIELAQHGFNHHSNYECAEMSYDDFDDWMYDGPRDELLNIYFSMGFKSPGWQTSNDVFRWLQDHDFWVADQGYNDNRRPKDLEVYKVGDNSVHGHTWNCVGNGIYETLPQLLEKVKETDDFRFVSEVLR